MTDYAQDDITFGWDDSIIGMANDLFVTFLSDDNNFVSYFPDRKLILVDTFIQSSKKFKSYMDGEKITLNRHKLIAAYTKAILAANFFEVNQENVDNYYRINQGSTITCNKLFPNEFLALVFIQTTLSASCIGSKKLWNLPSNYEIILPTTIYHFNENDVVEALYDEKLIKILCFYGQQKRQSKFPLVAFSDILFLLELSSDCAFFNLRDKYYEVN